MKKPNLLTALKVAKTFTAKHSPEILTGVGIAGMVTATVLAVKATPKAEILLRESTEEKGEALTNVEMVKACWKPYIPAIVTGGVSIACLIGASSVSTRRTAAFATAYRLSEKALNEYTEKVLETVGEKKEKAIKEKVDKAMLEKDPVSKKSVVITASGNTLCYDAVSGRYFKSDIEKINKTVNELNRRMLTDMGGYLSLNDFYDELGLDHIGVGDDLGWNVNSGLIDIYPTSHLADDGTPCLVINFRVAPQYDYYK